MTFKGYKPQPVTVTEDLSKNGVRFVVTRHYGPDGKSMGSTVDASCQCYGSDYAVHSNAECQNFKRQKMLDSRFVNG